jgi:periplasmic protein TonB
MFEDSLMESDNKIEAKSKYWSIAALLFDGGLLLALIVWPLLHPQALPMQVMAPLMVAPPPPPPPPPLASTPRVLIKSEMLNQQLQAPSRIPKQIQMLKEAAVAPSMDGVIGAERLADGTPGGLGTVLGSLGTESARVVKQASPRSLNISSGVMAGNLIEKTAPQYPAIAKAARIQGTVVLQATIAKTGLIQNLRVISGPPMLQQAAVDAVRSWRYKPYLLNGEPVDVETTINVVFNLGE